MKHTQHCLMKPFNRLSVLWHFFVMLVCHHFLTPFSKSLILCWWNNNGCFYMGLVLASVTCLLVFSAKSKRNPLKINENITIRVTTSIKCQISAFNGSNVCSFTLSEKGKTDFRDWCLISLFLFSSLLFCISFEVIMKACFRAVFLW